MRQPALPPFDDRTLAEALAVAWSIRFAERDPTETDMGDFTDWLLASPHNAVAWDRLEQLSLQLRQMATDLSGHPDQ
jgi:ferric-dicitrate binding protein FerR (iron transport regulator)